MSRKIIGVTVGSPLPKPNLMQTDPAKGDYVKGKEEFAEQFKHKEIDLTGYATEQFVRDGYQPKGDYVTRDELPDSGGNADCLPEYSEADNGKVLGIVNGTPAWIEATINGGGETPDVPDVPDTPVEPTSHGIVWDLVNVTSNNNLVSVTDGASLTAVLTPADGYTLGDVTVTMGGEVLTGVWNADTATVTIASVTGDVVVSCAGVSEPVEQTEQLTTMKWKNSGWPTFTDNGDGTYAVSLGTSVVHEELKSTTCYYTMFYPGEISGGVLSIKYNKLVTSGSLSIFVMAVNKDCTICYDVTKGGKWSGDHNEYAMTTVDDTFTIQMPEGTYPWVWFRKGSVVMEGDTYTTPENYDTALHFQNGDIQIFVTGASATAQASFAELVDNDYAMDYGVATASLVTDSAGTDAGDLSVGFANVVETAKNEWMTEANGNIDKIPLIIHTDQHGQTNKPLFDFISKIVDWYDVGKVINLGDTVNSYGADDLLNNAGLEKYVESMANVPYSKRIEIFGNHDTWGDDAGETGRYTTQNHLYKWFRNIYARRFDNHGNFVTYDNNYNVKYVVVSGYAYDADKGGYSYYILPSATIDKIIAELEKADGYDVVMLSHIPLTAVTRSDLSAIWVGRKAKTAGSVTDTYGVVHNFDFTGCDGEVLCGLHGHNHEDGHTYIGGLLDVWFDAYYQSPNCFYFVLVDRENRQLNIWKVDNTPQSQNFQIPFDQTETTE